MRRQDGADHLVERHQADGVLLMDHQVTERSCQANTVVELRQFLAIGVGHRGAEIHDQIAGHIGLGLELLQIILVGLGIDVPVEILQIIAGNVFAMFGKFNGESLKRTGMQTGQKTFDDELRLQIESSDLIDDFGTKILFGVGHEAILKALKFAPRSAMASKSGSSRWPILLAKRDRSVAAI